jgi:osmotically-inducible protein OsmY
MMALALLCGTVACSHESLARPQSSFDKAKGEFSAAYESIKSGASQTATAGKLALRGVGSGAVEITDRSKEALGKSGGKADDAWITTKVKTELAMAEGVKSGDVHVGTERGIVTLKGTVDDAAAAKHAIQTALDVKGVAAVHSELAYPTERVAPKIYTKKPGY